MKNRALLFALFILLVVAVLFIALREPVEDAGVAGIETEARDAGLELPSMDGEAFDWIGSRIYQNETGGNREYLVHWNAGEDFPSLGIGHFIWFPEGVDAPFDEQFPAMVDFVRQLEPQGAAMPAWLRELEPFAAPWSSKAQFEAALASPEVNELRDWLDATRQQQAQFIVSAFAQRWRELELPGGKKQTLTGLLQQLVDTPAGLFAVVDYYNFKGLGNNPRERYQGQGWGLVQVLDSLLEVRAGAGGCDDIVGQFKSAAASRLSLRVELSPVERNEARWLPGWLQRLAGYLPEKTFEDRFGACGFRVTPYVQNPASDAMTVIWLSNSKRAGQLRLRATEPGATDSAVFESNPVEAAALYYHPAEKCRLADCSEVKPPWLHQIRVTGLKPGSEYSYQVSQDERVAGGRFRTVDDGEVPVRFIVYADSETEPESAGKHALWSATNSANGRRRYPLDQTDGYRHNLEVIGHRQPDFVAIAGDIVESGGEQRDWDEFWWHNAGLAASIPIMPALGNHDYFGGPGELGKYSTEDSERAIRKYQSYFDLPPNGSENGTHSERYYALKYAQVTLIALDTTDGQPHQSDRDTNWRLRGENDAGHAPDWHPGSAQYEWLVQELRRAQQDSRFTFVMFHGAPYSSGIHARPPGILPRHDILSAQPIRSLTPLFLRHGVDAVFNGHDEMYEHSMLAGTEVTPAGVESAHEIHFFDIGIGGDGLRGPDKYVDNPYKVFLAHSDSPEVYSEQGVLIDGGKHYGHIEINVEKGPSGHWRAQLDPVYIFPLLDEDGHVHGVERRLYDDRLTLISNKQE